MLDRGYFQELILGGNIYFRGSLGVWNEERELFSIMWGTFRKDFEARSKVCIVGKELFST